MTTCPNRWPYNGKRVDDLTLAPTAIAVGVAELARLPTFVGLVASGDAAKGPHNCEVRGVGALGNGA